MIKRRFALAAALISGLGFVSTVSADSTQVGFDSGVAPELQLYTTAAKTTALSSGNLSLNGDGFVLQLGYYTNATIGNYFSGSFVALSGAGSAFNLVTTIGDDNTGPGGTQQSAVPNGEYFLQEKYTTGNTTDSLLPTVGRPLAVRFFNGTTLANSTLFGAVSAPSWLWVTPTPTGSNVNLTLNNAGLVWLGGNVQFTGTAVPEPGTVSATILGAILLGSVVIRRKLTV